MRTTLGTHTLTDGQASLTESALVAGEHAITATYAGEGALAASTSADLMQVVTAATTTTLEASANPSTFGEAVTFTATVSSSGGVPTGLVTFSEGATTLGAGSVIGGQATLGGVTLAAGVHTITASYSGDGSFGASASPVLDQSVTPAPTTTALGATPGTAAVGDPVTFTISVSAAGGVPTGTVTLLDGTTVVGTAPLLAGGAEITLTDLAIGAHQLTASYGGSADLLASDSPPVGVDIVAAPTITTLGSSANPSVLGTAVTFTATVSGAIGVPTGTVSFLDGATTIAGATLTDGAAAVSVTQLGAGPHSITAVYDGDPTFASSTSAALTQNVTGGTETSLATTPNPAIAGQVVTLTATVTSTGGTPTGTVTFRDGTVPLGVANSTAGQATITVSTLVAGSHSLTATYDGDGTFAPSTSAPISQAVTTVLRYVDKANPGCKNSASGGTITVPYCTINYAAGKVAPGQTVQVAAGTYSEKVTVSVSGTPAAPITFAPAPGAVVVITPGSNGFSIANKSWVTVRGFVVDDANGAGITVSDSSNITLDGNRVAHSGTPALGSTAVGIKLNGVTNSQIVNNVTDHNSDSGIFANGGSDGNVIAHNESFANARVFSRAAAGIDMRNGTGNVVSANLVHDNEDSGINIWTGLTNGSNLVVDNVAWSNGDHGIDVHNAVDTRIVANTVYGNTDSGIEATTSIGTHLANNISVDNAIGSTRTFGNIRIDTASIATTTVNDDLLFLRVAGVMVEWGNVKYSSLAAFRSATGQESRGIEGDPLFVDAPGANFHLLAGSLAIDSADSGVSGQPWFDFDTTSRYDAATGDTGIGPITYADRGAFEYRP